MKTKTIYWTNQINQKYFFEKTFITNFVFRKCFYTNFVFLFSKLHLHLKWIRFEKNQKKLFKFFPNICLKQFCKFFLLQNFFNSILLFCIKNYTYTSDSKKIRKKFSNLKLEFFPHWNKKIFFIIENLIKL